MDEKRGVVCVGQAVMDIVVRAVDEDIVRRAWTNAEEIAFNVGGDALNEAWTLAKLGVPVKLMAALGEDYAGNFVLDMARGAGIDTGYITRVPGISTTVSIVLIHKADGEHSFVLSGGTIGYFVPGLLDMASLRAAKVVSLASLNDAEPGDIDRVFLMAAKAAKEAGAIVCLDTAIRASVEALEARRELLSYTDYFFPNYDEASALTGEKEPEKIARVLLDFGVKTAIVKTGKAGCFVKNARDAFSSPAYNARRLDTTGAGDSFAAGFIYGLTRDMPLRDCAVWANAAASVSVQKLGARGAENVKEVEDMIARGPLAV